MPQPDDILFSKTHEWAHIEGDIATVGITDFAVEHLGDLAFVDLSEAGTEVQAGERFGEIESTKTVNDLLAPVSGEVVEVNGKLDDDIDLVQRSPFEDGWMVKIRCSNPEERQALLSYAEYKKQAVSEED